MNNAHLISFVTQMQERYPNVIFRFEFDPREKAYRIWHTYANAYSDDAFAAAMGRLIKDLFVPIGFFDFYIDLNTAYLSKKNALQNWSAAAPTVLKPFPKTSYSTLNWVSLAFPLPKIPTSLYVASLRSQSSLRSADFDKAA